MVNFLIKSWLVFVILLFLSGVKIYSQTFPCNIEFNKGGGVYNTRLIGQHREWLLVSDTGVYKIVDVRKIKNIKFDNGNHLWTGAGIGAAVGFIGGIVLYETFKGKKKTLFTKDATFDIGVLITVPCALIGGLLGTLFRNVDNYDLSKMNANDKVKEIKYIIRDHSMWR
ncbi:MAG: hypothetical protein ACRDFC_08665 [Ignavibacteria bacterium]